MPWGHDAVMCNESWMMGWHYDIPGTAGVLYHAFGAHSVLPPMFCLRLPTDGLITVHLKQKSLFHEDHGLPQTSFRGCIIMLACSNLTYFSVTECSVSHWLKCWCDSSWCGLMPVLSLKVHFLFWRIKVTLFQTNLSWCRSGRSSSYSSTLWSNFMTQLETFWKSEHKFEL